jgi:hypothetical protein
VLLKAEQVHLWFVTIQHFEDSNNRLARTLIDLLLARADAKARLHHMCPAYLLYQVLGRHSSERQAGSAQIGYSGQRSYRWPRH